MHVRCNYCGQSFNLSRDYVVDALNKAEKGQKYHAVECFNCRKTVKVPLVQLRHAVPSPPAGGAADAEAETESET